MPSRKVPSAVKPLAVLLSIVCFLFFSLIAVAPVLAADQPAGGAKWETWPRRPETSGTPPATTAVEVAGAKTSEGISAGTWGWIAGGVAAAALIAVAAGGGGGGDSSPACNQ